MKFSQRIITLVIFLQFLTNGYSQLQIQPSAGKAFHMGKSGYTALRYSVAINNIFYDRIGFYFSYENRTANMPFDNHTYTDAEFYSRDLLGINYKIKPELTIYGGLGAFQNGIFSHQFQSKGGGIPWIVKPVGIRKEIGLQYNHVQSGLSLSMGYSFSVGITGNIGFCIPLYKNFMTVHQVITEDPRSF
ncbi:MAG: hypothetical protein ACO3AQ_08990 [Bacteroidia bacterium]